MCKSTQTLFIDTECRDYLITKGIDFYTKIIVKNKRKRELIEIYQDYKNDVYKAVKVSEIYILSNESYGNTIIDLFIFLDNFSNIELQICGYNTRYDIFKLSCYIYHRMDVMYHKYIDILHKTILIDLQYGTPKIKINNKRFCSLSRLYTIICYDKTLDCKNIHTARYDCIITKEIYDTVVRGTKYKYLLHKMLY